MTSDQRLDCFWFGYLVARAGLCGQRLQMTDGRTAGSCCGPEIAAGRPAAGRNDVHCAVVAVTVDVFGRAGRSKCGQRLHDGQTDGLIESLRVNSSIC